jgi:NADH-quinone oxidoreductase subunit N
MLAYSSIAHSGYIMISLAAIGLSSTASLELQSNLLFYIIAFVLSDLAAFSAVIIISNRLNSDHIKHFAGIGQRSPILASALTLALVSLTGLPPAAGFIAKFYIFSGAVESDLLWLVIIAVIASIISAFYYLRVVKLMWLNEPISDEKFAVSSLPKLALVLSCFGILVTGIAPALIIKITEAAASMLGS